jgi:hypothetical protein
MLAMALVLVVAMVLAARDLRQGPLAAMPADHLRNRRNPPFSAVFLPIRQRLGNRSALEPPPGRLLLVNGDMLCLSQP